MASWSRKSGAEQVVAGTPVKGLGFEEEVHAILSRIVRQRKGDELEGTGTSMGGLSKSKNGDFLVRFAENPGSPLAIETKDEAHTLPELNRTLEKILENRGAAYAMLVSKNVEALPDSVGWFNEYGNNKLVVALGASGSGQVREEVLNITITWARLRILLQTPTREMSMWARLQRRLERQRQPSDGSGRSIHNAPTCKGRPARRPRRSWTRSPSLGEE